MHQTKSLLELKKGSVAHSCSSLSGNESDFYTKSINLLKSRRFPRHSLSFSSSHAISGHERTPPHYHHWQHHHLLFLPHPLIPLSQKNVIFCFWPPFAGS